MTETEDKSAIIPNIDQAEFKGLVERSLRKLCKHVPGVTMIGYRGQGYLYQDYVVTIVASRDRKSCEVFRNRDGAMVFSMTDGRITGINYEYIFIDRHIRSKLGEA